MLNEPESLFETPTPAPAEAETRGYPPGSVRARLRDAVDQVLTVEHEHDLFAAPIAATYVGTLRIDSAEAFTQLKETFGNLGYVPVFRMKGTKHAIRAVRQYAAPKPRPWWPNALLLVATIFSLLYTGATMELGRVDLPSILDLLRGWPYAVGLMLILGTHEMGHYIAARRHGVAVTLPYFIPLPIAGTLGTLGAFIQLREPVRDRRTLLDIGVSGPLAGLVVAIPVLLIGLATSRLSPLPMYDVFSLKTPTVSYIVEGDSLLYAGLKWIVFGQPIPNGMQDIWINQLAQAGWTGLLITAINLIPVGQLDGGHALYSLLGERARFTYMPMMLILFGLSLIYPGWLLWFILLLLLGRFYATPLDEITALNRGRRAAAILSLIVFVLVFIPVPLQEITFGR